MDRDELIALTEKERAAWKAVRIHCCTASGCLASAKLDIKKTLQQAAVATNMTDRVQVVGVGCLGLCGRGPLVEFATPGASILFERVGLDAAPSMAMFNGGRAGSPQVDTSHPFFASQMKIVCEMSGKIDPERIEEYIAVWGYRSLHHALTEMTPADVVQEITRSGLRGRGGAGYPTGLKWATVAKQPSGQKYVVCNGDEGDPGAFMDRSVMESDPHRVLEGMAIAGYAVGASQGFVYVRAEYPLAVERLQKAIAQAKRLGVLGTAVFETPFDFRIDVRIGAGAFVCGEETALMQSIEGKRGMPRPHRPTLLRWDCGIGRLSSTTSRRSPTSRPSCARGPTGSAPSARTRARGPRSSR